MHLSIAEGFDSMRNHWVWERGWRPGRAKYAFHLTWDEAPAVEAVAMATSPVLAHFTQLDPIPVPWLHMTLTGIGFVDEVSGDALAAITDDVFSAWRPGTVTFDGMLVVHEAVLMTALGEPWLATLVDVQRDACDRHLGTREWRGFWPHTSVSYCHGAQDPKPLRDALSPVVAELPTSITATPTLTLMRIRRDDDRVYRWDVLREA